MKLFLSILFFICFALMLYYEFLVLNNNLMTNDLRLFIFLIFLVINFLYGFLIYQLLKVIGDN